MFRQVVLDKRFPLSNTSVASAGATTEIPAPVVHPGQPIQRIFSDESFIVMIIIIIIIIISISVSININISICCFVYLLRLLSVHALLIISDGSSGCARRGVRALTA